MTTGSVLSSRFKALVAAARRARLPRRALIFVVIGGAVALGVTLIWRPESAPSASQPQSTVKATRGDVVLTVGGVGRIVESRVATDIAVPSASAGGTGGASASVGSSAPAVTSGMAVFPKTSAHLIRFLVVPGEHVTPGQPVALLGDNGAAGAAVAQAQNDVGTALLELRQKRTSDPLTGFPPTRAELAAARGAIRSARSRLAQLLRGARPAEIAAARLDLRRAEADLETITGGSPEDRADAIQLATRAVELAQRRLDKLLGPPDPADVAAAQADLKKAQAELAVLQQPGSGALPAEIEAARAAVYAAQRKLDRLLGPADQGDVTAARLELERARAELRRLKAGPSKAAVAAARQAVATARAKLAQLLAPPSKSDVTAAGSDVLKAEADLAVLRVRGGPALPLDIALARLRVVGAQLRLASARIAKPLLLVRAPSAGTVTELLTVPGAPVDPVTPIASIADLDHLGVSVDLSEFDVARVMPGLKATVSVDALGGRTFPGKVVFAGLTGTNVGGVITFPVRVAIAHSRGLRPGMNVSVRITVAKRLDVVQVPVEAVTRDDEDRATVTVVGASGNTSERRVTLGLASNKSVQIVKGLRAGERVVLPESQGQQEEE